MNLIKALNGLSPAEGGGEKNAAQTEIPAEPHPTPRAAQPEQQVNVMASVLERHERISNRVKNKK